MASLEAGALPALLDGAPTVLAEAPVRAAPLVP